MRSLRREVLFRSVLNFSLAFVSESDKKHTVTD